MRRADGELAKGEGQGKLLEALGPRSDVARTVLSALEELLVDASRKGRSKIARALEVFALDEVAAATLEEAALPSVLASQTYLALVAKLLGSCAAARGQTNELPWASPRLSTRGLRFALAGLESGALLERLGVRGFTDLEDRGRDSDPEQHPFAFYLDGFDSPRVAEAIALLCRHIAKLAARVEEFGSDPFSVLQTSLVARQVRRRSGAFYTPPWLAERLLDLTLGERVADLEARVLDPSCGSGIFLALLLRARCAAVETGPSSSRGLAVLLDGIAGVDLSSLAVLFARTNLLLAIAPLLAGREGEIRIPVERRDILAWDPGRVFEFVVGNPPWIGWEGLSTGQRARARPLFERYRLFAHSGMETILGQGKKEIAGLFTFSVAERCLAPSGRLGFVLPLSLFRAASAGRGFRRLTLPDGTPLGPIVFEDLARAGVRPFDGSTPACLVVLERGRPIRFPIPHTRIEGEESTGGVGGVEIVCEVAAPIDDADLTSPWIVASPDALAAVRKLVGRSAHVAAEGANTGGANGVFFLEVLERRRGGRLFVRNLAEAARRKVASECFEIEEELVYPLLRGRDVSPFSAHPSAHLLVAQDPSTRRGFEREVLAARCPRTLEYLDGHEPLLASRPLYRRYFREGAPPWSMFNISASTFAPFKAVWREQASLLTAAAVLPDEAGRPVVPDHKLMMIAVSSAACAHYLAGLLNSAPSRFLAAALVLPAQMGTHLLARLAIPAFDPDDPVHARLARLAEQARLEAPTTPTLLEEIDDCSFSIFGLTEEDRVVFSVAAALRVPSTPPRRRSNWFVLGRLLPTPPSG